MGADENMKRNGGEGREKGGRDVWEPGCRQSTWDSPTASKSDDTQIPVLQGTQSGGEMVGILLSEPTADVQGRNGRCHQGW